MAFTLVAAVGDKFIDRKSVVDEMLETLSSSRVYMGFALIGARRMGKTSILKEVCRMLNQRKKTAAVYLSLWDLNENTVDEFCRKLVEETMEVFKKRLSIKYHLKNLITVPASKIMDFLRTIGIQILDASSAFYRQFIVKQIGPFPKEVVRDLLEKNLDAKINDAALEQVYSVTAGIPFYVQFLGRGIERRGISKVTAALVEDVYKEFLREEGNLIFTEEFQRLTEREKAILIKMAKEDIVRPVALAEKLSESANLIGRYLEYLILKGLIIKKDKGVYEIVDPCLKDWLKGKE